MRIINQVFVIRYLYRRRTHTSKIGIGCIIFIAVLSCNNSYAARYGATVNPNFDQTVTTSVSYGVITTNSAEFAGVTVNYGEVINPGLSWAAAIAWDNQRKNLDLGSVERINTFTAIATVGYIVNDLFDVSFGIGKGFIDDDNAGEKFELVNGDFSVGGSAGWTFWTQGRRLLNLSTSLEYNFDQREPSISMDLGYGISF